MGDGLDELGPGSGDFEAGVGSDGVWWVAVQSESAQVGPLDLGHIEEPGDGGQEVEGGMGELPLLQAAVGLDGVVDAGGYFVLVDAGFLAWSEADVLRPGGPTLCAQQAAQLFTCHGVAPLSEVSCVGKVC
ncbi:hypothetical protein ADL22_12560 [Streptomyces sp. NRRL F-4489]|nr:hypothetical protein ADL22_12560 [Streptomyces sp. NRRL F-4489]